MTIYSSRDTETPRTSRTWRALAVIGTLLLSVFLMIALNPGSGAFAADVNQCDAEGLSGSGLDCHVQVVNNIDLNDPTQNFSTVTTTRCLGAANDALNGSCSTTVIPTTSVLTLNVDQCNGSTTSTSTLFCTVDILNQVTGGTGIAEIATVNECIGSGGGGGIVAFACDSWVDPAVLPPTAVNAPVATATVVQCNGSANGGGNLLDCSMDIGSTTSTDLPVKVNQCNGSGDGNGSSVICRTRIRTVFRATIAVPTYSTTTTTPQAVPVLPSTHAVAAVVAPAPVVIPAATAPTTGGSGGGGTGTTSSRDRLARTGSLAQTGSQDPTPIGIAALALLLAGVGAVLIGRRPASPRT